MFFAVRGPLTVVASPVAEHRLRTRRLGGHGSRALPLRGMWDLPRPGHEPVSPASAGGLSTTAPPGKPNVIGFFSLLLIPNCFNCYLYNVLLSDRISLPSLVFQYFPGYSCKFTFLCKLSYYSINFKTKQKLEIPVDVLSLYIKLGVIFTILSLS